MEIKEREEAFSNHNLVPTPVESTPVISKDPEAQKIVVESGTVPEQRVLTEQEKIEVADSGATGSQQTQDQSSQPATDPSPPTLTTVDPQDQLTIEEIDKQEKAALTEAVTWLANWWKRQIKILNQKRRI